MKTFIKIVLSIFIGCVIGAAICYIFIKPTQSETVVVSPDMILKIISYIYTTQADGTTDEFVNVQVKGDIFIPIEQLDNIKFENAIVSSNGHFSINDTTKWISSKILNEGEWYTQKEHQILCDYGVLDFYKTDSICWYEGDDIHLKSKIIH